MSSRLPFEALRNFAEIARGRSAAEAATRSHVTPGAVSQRIAVLEAHVRRLGGRGRRARSRDPAVMLRHLPLIRQPGLDEWPVWLDAYGVQPEAVIWGPCVSDDAASLRAAELRQGIAIVRAGNITSRPLLHVLAYRPAPGNATTYYLVSRRVDTAFRPIKRLHDWAAGEWDRQRGGADAGQHPGHRVGRD